MSKLKYDVSDDESLVNALRIIMNSSEILSATETMERVRQLLAKANGHIGGSTTLARHGRQHYIDMVNARKDRPQRK